MLSFVELVATRKREALVAALPLGALGVLATAHGCLGAPGAAVVLWTAVLRPLLLSSASVGASLSADASAALRSACDAAALEALFHGRSAEGGGASQAPPPALQRSVDSLVDAALVRAHASVLAHPELRFVYTGQLGSLVLFDGKTHVGEVPDAASSAPPPQTFQRFLPGRIAIVNLDGLVSVAAAAAAISAPQRRQLGGAFFSDDALSALHFVAVESGSRSSAAHSTSSAARATFFVADVASPSLEPFDSGASPVDANLLDGLRSDIMQFESTTLQFVDATALAAPLDSAVGDVAEQICRSTPLALAPQVLECCSRLSTSKALIASILQESDALRIAGDAYVSFTAAIARDSTIATALCALLGGQRPSGDASAPPTLVPGATRTTASLAPSTEATPALATAGASNLASLLGPGGLFHPSRALL